MPLKAGMHTSPSTQPAFPPPAPDWRQTGRMASYLALVARRRAHRFPRGLLNPAGIQGGRWDSDHLGPWSCWQGALDAEVVVVGQDWGNEALFLKGKGRPSDGDPTNVNLRAMAHRAGWDMGSPEAPRPQPIYLTHAVLGIRAMGNPVTVPPIAWIDDSVPFLVQLLEIIRPRALVSLGRAALRSCRLALLDTERNGRMPDHPSVNQAHARNPILHPGKPVLFAFYHCSPLGLSNRSLEHQFEDWQFLGEWLRAGGPHG